MKSKNTDFIEACSGIERQEASSPHTKKRTYDRIEIGQGMLSEVYVEGWTMQPSFYNKSHLSVRPPNRSSLQLFRRGLHQNAGVVSGCRLGGAHFTGARLLTVPPSTTTCSGRNATTLMGSDHLMATRNWPLTRARGGPVSVGAGEVTSTSHVNWHTSSTAAAATCARPPSRAGLTKKLCRPSARLWYCTGDRHGSYSQWSTLQRAGTWPRDAPS